MHQNDNKMLIHSPEEGMLILAGDSMNRVFNSRCGRACQWHSFTLLHNKQPILKLKTQPTQLLGSLPLAYALPA